MIIKISKLPLWLLIIFLLLIFAIININTYGQVVSSPNLPSTSAGTVQQTGVSYSEMLALYKDVLETTRWTTTIIVTLFSLSGIGAIYFYRQAEKGISELNASISEYKDRISSIKQQNDELTNRIMLSEKQIIDIFNKATNITTTIDSVSHKFRLLQIDINDKLPQLQKISMVYSNSIKLWNIDPTNRAIAISNLLELSKDDDPVVRRMCIKSFKSIDSSCFSSPMTTMLKHKIIARMEWISNNDQENALRKDANDILIYIREY